MCILRPTLPLNFLIAFLLSSWWNWRDRLSRRWKEPDICSCWVAASLPRSRTCRSGSQKPRQVSGRKTTYFGFGTWRRQCWTWKEAQKEWWTIFVLNIPINTCKHGVHFLDEIGPSRPVEVARLRRVQVGSLVAVAVVVLYEGTVHLLTTIFD